MDVDWELRAWLRHSIAAVLERRDSEAVRRFDSPPIVSVKAIDNGSTWVQTDIDSGRAPERA